MTGNGPMKFVLDHFVKIVGVLGLRVVVDATLGVDVSDLLVEASLAGSDLLYSFQKLVEIIFAELFPLLESFVVEDESFNDEFAEGLCGPNTEAGGFYGVDAVADGYDVASRL